MTTAAKQPSFDAPATEWLVYADALQEARDPRGELIVLNHAVESGKTPAADRDAYVAKHVEALIGKGVQAERYRFGWTYGLLDSAEILVDKGEDAAEAIAALFASPVAANLRRVSLVGVSKNGVRVDLREATGALASTLPATCTSVAFVDDRAAKTTMLSSRDFDPGDNLVQFGDLSGQETWNGRTSVQVQYWRSRDQLMAYARKRDSSHLPAWSHFNRVISKTTAVGIWHETYCVRAGEYECIYGNMPSFGLAKASERLNVAAKSETAKGRLGITDGRDTPADL